MDNDRLELPEHRVYVLGQPRSGTSMMTHVCELLGVRMQHSTERPKQIEMRNKQYAEMLGAYHPNSGGFFEIGNNQLIPTILKIAELPFSGCKMILPVLDQARKELLTAFPCKVIYMKRSPQEVAGSQNAFYAYDKQVESVEKIYAMADLMLAERKVSFIEVEYRAVLDNPAEAITRIAEFIEARIPIADAVASIDSNKIRFKKEELIKTAVLEVVNE